MQVTPIHIGDNISNSFNENKGNQTFRSDFSDSPIIQSVNTTPNMNESAHKITSWYSRPLFTHFIWHTLTYFWLTN